MQGAHTPSENGCGKEQDGVLQSLHHVNLSGERIVDKNCEIISGNKKNLTKRRDYYICIKLV
jgi:hypothetical protein